MATLVDRPRAAARAPAASSPAPPAAPPRRHGAPLLLAYLLLGLCFGTVLVKAEAISWFRIQEMFRLQAFHLYGVMGSAVVTTGIALRLLRRRARRALDGTPIALPPKAWGSGARYVLGGTIFGLGWAIAGACPGPFYALLGAGAGTILVPLGAALGGAWVYGWLRPRLPH